MCRLVTKYSSFSVVVKQQKKYQDPEKNRIETKFGTVDDQKNVTS